MSWEKNLKRNVDDECTERECLFSLFRIASHSINRDNPYHLSHFCTSRNIHRLGRVRFSFLFSYRLPFCSIPPISPVSPFHHLYLFFFPTPRIEDRGRLPSSRPTGNRRGHVIARVSSLIFPLRSCQPEVSVNFESEIKGASR